MPNDPHMTDIESKIERAVAGERERCAKIADAEAERAFELRERDSFDAANNIADAIRKGDR